jgi:hypothetical protein
MIPSVDGPAAPFTRSYRQKRHRRQTGRPDGAAFVEGAYVPIAEAKLPILDGGFRRSDCTSGIPIDLAWLAFPRVVARSLPVHAVSASAGRPAHVLRPDATPRRIFAPSWSFMRRQRRLAGAPAEPS